MLALPAEHAYMNAAIVRFGNVGLDGFRIGDMRGKLGCRFAISRRRYRNFG